MTFSLQIFSPFTHPFPMLFFVFIQKLLPLKQKQNALLHKNTEKRQINCAIPSIAGILQRQNRAVLLALLHRSSYLPSFPVAF